MTNQYIKRIQETEVKRGRDAAIERGQNMLCSWSLGRDFNESCDSFMDRNPDMKEFQQWFEAYQ